ncbi:MAG: ChbG/HpnK family deacetylase [Acidimicrobiales bacterium]
MTRRVVVHVDDVGMCHGANRAFVELSASGFATSGSVMVPCPWFAEAAECAASDPALDLGVHLTLTAEKRHYKWGPVSGVRPGSGLTDANGHFWRDVAAVRANCRADAAAAELRTQIDIAIAAGIDVTHLDTHMGVTNAPELCDTYLDLARELDVPLLLTRDMAHNSTRAHLEGVDPARYDATVTRARSLGFTVFDEMLETEWNPTARPIDVYRELFSSIGDGLTFLALHPNAPGELHLIEPRSEHVRVGEYELFCDPAFAGWVDDLGIERVGMRELREELRA